MPEISLDGKTALVTGASRGIGAAIATIYAAAGANVVLSSRKVEALDEVAATLPSEHVMTFAANAGEPDQAEACVQATVERFGAVDILVNNAGVTRRAYIMDLTEADWDRIMRVNGKGVFFCLQRVAREMIARRSGVIVNIASIAGKGYAGTSNAIYAASKGAVIAMTRIAALQLAPHNINVNAICPGITVTALSQDNLTTRARDEGVTVEEMERRRNSVIPLGRANDPEDVAATAVFLASPGARNITGQSFNVDGGVRLD